MLLHFNKAPGKGTHWLLLLCAVLLLTAGVGLSVAHIVTGTPTLLNLFYNGLEPDAGLTIQKNITHPLGDNYPLPNDLTFDFTADLGAAYADKTVSVTQYVGGQSETGDVTADPSGRITLTVKPGADAKIHDLLVGTEVTVTEAPRPGFTPDAPSKTLTIDKAQDNTLVFTNTYAPASAPVNLTVSGVKTLVGRDWKDGDSFTFGLYRILDQTETEVGTATVTYDAANPAFNTFDFNAALAAYPFDAVGEYVFKVREISGTIGGVTYDTAESVFTVTVGDADMDGALEIQNVASASQNTTVTPPTDNSAATAAPHYAVAIAFENHYAPAGSDDVTLSIEKSYTDALTGAALDPSGFAFALYPTDANYTVDPAAAPQTVTTDAAGQASFKLVFTPRDLAPGEFYFLLQEQYAGESRNGVQYDPAAYRLHISVYDNMDGTISALVFDNTPNAAVPSGQDNYTALFANTYDPEDAKLTLSGTKTLTGRTLAPDEFTFALYEADANFVAVDSTAPHTAHNAADGSFSFDELTFAQAGTYRYLVTEDAAAALPGITYDPTEYRVTVTVSETDETGAATPGTLHAAIASIQTATGAATPEGLAFENTYTPNPVNLTLSGSKLLDGRPLQPGEFTFALYETDSTFAAADGATPVTVQNDADGLFRFPQMTYDQPGIYYYLVKEDPSAALPGITYDEATYQITVEVDDQNGNLTTSTTVKDTASGFFTAPSTADHVFDLAFNNRYQPTDGELLLSGTKTLTGRDLAAEEFTFHLYETASDFVVAEGATPLATARNDADGRFAFDPLSFDEAGTYTYVIAEDPSVALPGIVYDQTRYHLTVEVTDQNGAFTPSLTITDSFGEAKTDIAFANEYREDQPVLIPLEALKSLDGAALEAEAFTFHLYQADRFWQLESEPLQSVKNDAVGRVLFEALSFTEPGEHRFVLLEEIPEEPNGIVYDTTQYQITVTVSRADDGTLTATCEVTTEQLLPVEYLLFLNRVATGDEIVDSDGDGIPDDEDDDDSTPPTGDPSNLVLWLVLLFAALAGGGTALWLLLRRKARKE